MTPVLASHVLTEHMKFRRGESGTYIHEHQLAEAIRIACMALEAIDREARLMADAHAQLMASRGLVRYTVARPPLWRMK